MATTVKAGSVDEVIREHPPSREHLIAILQDVQELEGYLSRESINRIGDYLRLPPSKIYGVATFYNQFKLQKPGKIQIQVCRGTACHVKGSNRVLEMAQKLLKLKPGQTSRDRLFSLEVVACMGACGLSPVMNLNGEFYAKVTPKRLVKIIQECRETESKNGH